MAFKSLVKWIKGKPKEKFSANVVVCTTDGKKHYLNLSVDEYWNYVKKCFEVGNTGRTPKGVILRYPPSSIVRIEYHNPPLQR